MLTTLYQDEAATDRLAVVTEECRPLITVIVPVYNVADYVERCISSLRTQAFPEFEATVIDDGSTDESLARIKAAVGSDTRFTIVQQQNQGLSAARNAGLDRARGQFIAFVDSDDWVAPDYLRALHDALAHSDADWAACAIDLHSESRTTAHSAIHGAARLSDHPVPRLFRLSNCSDVIRHFPSAWNKLYRRELIEGLRFEPGRYEDHTFFQRAAARTDTLLHLPQPLYHHRRGRHGQITGQGDDRVFDQFAVLRDIGQILDTSGRPGAAMAFSRLATRLLDERSRALRGPERRVRFAEASAQFLKEHNLSFEPEWDNDIARSWGTEIQGRLPLSVIITWDGRDSAALARTVQALSDEVSPRRQTLFAVPNRARVSHPDPEAIHKGPDALASAVLAARGEYVVVLNAGDRLLPGTALRWVEEMMRHQSDVGLSKFMLGANARHDGLHDQSGLDHPLAGGVIDMTAELALRLETRLSAWIFRREFLSRTALPRPGMPPEGFALAASLSAAKVIHFDWPGVKIVDEVVRQSMPSFLSDIDAIPALPTVTAAPLPRGWSRRLYLRSLWQQVTLVPRSCLSRAAFVAGASAGALLCGLIQPSTIAAGIDPFIGPRFQRLAGRAGQAVPSPQGASPMFAFPLEDRGLFRFRTDFRHFPYANLSFYAEDRATIPFHLSLRQDAGLAVCNDRAGDGTWRTERTKPVRLPKDGSLVTIRFDPPAVMVDIDGVEVFRFRGRGLRRGFRGLDGIRMFDMHGGIRLEDLRPQDKAPGLSLDSRLMLRSLLTEPRSGESSAGSGRGCRTCRGSSSPLV